MSTYPAPLFLSEEPFATPTAIEVPDDVAVVQMRHEGVSASEVMGIFDAGYQVLAGLGPGGPGYATYVGDVDATFDLTIGFPLRGDVVGVPADLPPGVERGMFPSGPAWAVSHRGSFDGLGEAWAALLAEVGTQVPGTRRRMVEIYVTDPSVTDVADLRTDLLLLAD